VGQLDQEEGGDLGLAGRMVRVFYAPGETFAAVRQRCGWTDWFAPVLLMAVLGVAGLQLAMPVIQQTQREMLQERLKQMPNMSEEQRAAALKMAEKSTGPATLVMVPVSAFAILFILGGVLLLVARLLLHGEATYAQTLAVWGYATLIGIPALLVRIPLMLAKQTAVVHLGPGVFVSDEAMKTFAGRFVAGIDLFSFWQVAVAAVGLAVLTGAPARKALIPLLVLWALWIAGQAAMGGLMPGGGG
jgi:hypothetical protein